jgi:hypothetical protein
VVLGQRPPRRRRRLTVLGIALIVSVAAVASADGFDPDSDLARAPGAYLSSISPGPSPIVVDISRVAVGRPIPPGFVGLSLEYTTISPYAGSRPAAVDPAFAQLVRGLAPGQHPVLRIGGDTTDWTWWPVPGMAKPAGIRLAIGPRYGALLHALAAATGARLILGINLEADSRRIASLEAARLLRALGRNSVEALELGNEPELYGSWPWRITPTGRRIIGRPPDYGVSAYIRDYRTIASSLPRVNLAGPALGGPEWISRLEQFINAEPRLALVTVHTYPLQECDTPLVAPTFPTLSRLLAPRASRGLAGQLAAAVRAAHRKRLPLRVDEINSVACGGAPGVSNTFASALWALDTMFALARTGVDGVNVHTFQIATYRLFRTRFHDGRWRAAVAPEYYGLLLFARAAPPGARLLRIARVASSIRAWATRATNGTTHVVLINENPAAGRVVEVRGSLGGGPAAYEALRGSRLGATGDVSLGTASFGATTLTGVLPAPRRIFVRPQRGAYVVRVPAASALMLTVRG